MVDKLLDDDHPLNVTAPWPTPTCRPRTLELLDELADGRALPDGTTLEDFRRAHPGEGSVFDLPDRDVNFDADGNSRKQEFVDETKADDPARAVGAEPTPEQRALVTEYGRAAPRQGRAGGGHRGRGRRRQPARSSYATT